jgi:hypothetical protein
MASIIEKPCRPRAVFEEAFRTKRRLSATPVPRQRLGLNPSKCMDKVYRSQSLGRAFAAMGLKKMRTGL